MIKLNQQTNTLSSALQLVEEANLSADDVSLLYHESREN